MSVSGAAGLSFRASAASTASRSGFRVLPLFSALAPTLSGPHTKGDHGRVTVIGGSPVFSGAPYFAASAALALGADLASVICHPDAATAIKSYSPELMVKPHLLKVATDEAVVKGVKREGALVVGPGLDHSDAANVTKMLQSVFEKSASIDDAPFVVLDAAGATLVAPALLPHTANTIVSADTHTADSAASGAASGAAIGATAIARRVVLTPNDREFALLYSTLFPNNKSVGSDNADTRGALGVHSAVDSSSIPLLYRIAPDCSESRDNVASVSSATSDSAASAHHSADEMPVLTQFSDLANVLVGFETNLSAVTNPAVRVARMLGGVTVVRKSTFDLITNGTLTIVNLGGLETMTHRAYSFIFSTLFAQAHLVGQGLDPPSTPPQQNHKRCGGIGDILAGAIGITTAWAKTYIADANARTSTSASSTVDCEGSVHNTISANDRDIGVIAAAFASVLARIAAQDAVRARGRKTTAQDVIARLDLFHGIHAFDDEIRSNIDLDALYKK